VKLHITLKHKHIVEMFHAINGPSMRVLVMELCDCTLEKHLHEKY
jgi:hypothetical protein